MNALIRLAVVVAVVLPLAVLGCFGFRFACHPVGRLLQEVRYGEVLDKTHQAVLRRLKSKEQVVCDVIAQRCSLQEALARFQELDREFDPDWPASFPKLSEIRARKWTSEVERHYQYITTGAKSLLDGRPEETAAVLRRLEKDYQQLQTSTQTRSTGAMERTEQSR
ncbi:MAG TPA: hypothetical protein VH682_13515 [Gemmataceae bacterium]|jgi:hypothetical protein